MEVPVAVAVEDHQNAIDEEMVITAAEEEFAAAAEEVAAEEEVVGKICKNIQLVASSHERSGWRRTCNLTLNLPYLARALAVLWMNVWS